jgi:hypothetical protein
LDAGAGAGAVCRSLLVVVELDAGARAVRTWMNKAAAAAAAGNAYAAGRGHRAPWPPVLHRPTERTRARAGVEEQGHTRGVQGLHG